MRASSRRRSSSASTGRYLEIMEGLLDGAIATARGDVDGGLAKVVAAARIYDAMPFDFGPPATIKPPHELAGDILSAAGRHAEAAREYQVALKWAPRRALSVGGLADAEAAAAPAGAPPKP